MEDDGETHRRRQRQPSSSPSKGRRRTASRERDQSQTRGRHVSRSPVKRSENVNSNVVINRPSKMVSIPATVSCLAMDKSNNPEQQISCAAVRKISVRKNVRADGGSVAGSRTVASPRSRSPAKTNQQSSLSRSNSKKAEHSPYRRNPLSEIDSNSLAHSPNNKASMSKPKADNKVKMATQATTTNNKSGRGTPKKKANKRVDEQQQPIADEAKTQPPITRSRSSRLSQDLDINPESLINPQPSSYTARLLEDIQNFHQKSNNNNNQTFSLPACVTKACSIVDAVANLNSTSSSNSDNSKKSNVVVLSKDRTIVESEVIGSDDLMEPSFHKYVTLSNSGGEIEEQESSGSNSFVENGNRKGLNKKDSSFHKRQQTGVARGRMGTSRASTR